MTWGNCFALAFGLLSGLFLGLHLAAYQWRRFRDAAEALLETLPRCSRCNRIATHAHRRGEDRFKAVADAITNALVHDHVKAEPIDRETWAVKFIAQAMKVAKRVDHPVWGELVEGSFGATKGWKAALHVGDLGKVEGDAAERDGALFNLLVLLFSR